MENFFEKNWLVALALVSLFFAWSNSFVQMQTVSIPAIFLYLLLLAKNSKPKLRIVLLVILVLLLPFSNILFIGLQKDTQILSDIPAFIKVATQKIAEGKNPYSESFKGTAMDELEKANIAFWKAEGETRYVPIDTFTYLPAIFLVSVPFYLLFPTANFALLAAALLIMALSIVCCFFIKNSEKLETALIFAFFNPFIYFSIKWAHPVELLMLLTALLFTLALLKKKYSIAGFFFGILLATKAYVLLIAPFFYYFLIKERQFKTIAVSIAVFLILVLPFALWNPQDFASDALLFGVDSGSHSQLIWKDRPGLLPLLVSMSIITNKTGWIAIPLITIACIALFFLYIKKKPSIENAFVFSATTVFIALFLSKSMNEYYLNLPFALILCFALAKLSHNVWEPQAKSLGLAI